MTAEEAIREIRQSRINLADAERASFVRRLGPAAADATRELLGCLSQADATEPFYFTIWSTGDLQIASGRGATGNLVYRCLTRLHELGHVRKLGGRTHAELRECLWQWLPSEGTCDLLPVWDGPAPCADECWSWGRCWACQSWARRNLGYVPRRRPTHPCESGRLAS